MNERNKNTTVIMVYWCFLFAMFGVQICSGYSVGNTIKDYNNKDYLVSSSSAVNKFEDNEIRGEFKTLLDQRDAEVSTPENFFVIKHFTVRSRETPKGEII